MSVVILLTFGTFTVQAQDSVQQIWEQIGRSATENDVDATRFNCKKLIMTAQPFDSLAVLSRYILAEMSLNGNDMSDIYESYAYFRYYNDNFGKTDIYEDLQKRLKSTYDSLLILDKQQILSEGIYFSDSHTENHQPLLLLHIFKSGGTEWRAQMLDGCYFMENRKNRKRGGITVSSNILQSKDGNTFSVFWHDTHERKPQTELAHSAIDQGRQLKAEMYGTISAAMANDSYNRSDVIGGTVVTELVSGLFVIAGSLFARGKAVNLSNELVWSPMGDGILDAKLIHTEKKMHTGDSDYKEKSDDITFRLFKLYPHHEIFFYDKTNKQIITCDNERISIKNIDPAFKCFAPSAFSQKILSSLGSEVPCSFPEVRKAKDINGLMYKYFEYNTLFSSLKDDPIYKYVPDFSELESVYLNDGILALGKYSKKRGDFEQFCAQYKRNGTITYSQLLENTDTTSRYMSVYDNLGGYFYGEFIGDRQEGYGYMRYQNGNIYEGEMVNTVRNGNGTYYYIDGSVFKGRFEDDKCIDGKQVYKGDDFVYEREMSDGEWKDLGEITYINGDKYKGEVDDKYLPHGKGVITYLSGKVVQGEWVNGKKKEFKNKKKYARRKNRIRRKR